jgi:hypothetical protein
MHKKTIIQIYKILNSSKKKEIIHFWEILQQNKSIFFIIKILYIIRKKLNPVKLC